MSVPSSPNPQLRKRRSHHVTLACFLGALQFAAARANKKELAEKAQVTANVFIGHPTLGPDGFGLRAEINVVGCEDDNVIADAHEVGGYC